MTDMLDDLYEEPQGQKEESDYPDCPFLREHCPKLADFIRFDSYKGKQRTCGKISFTSDGTIYLLTMTDPNQQRYFTVICHNIREGLELMDQHIATRQCHWRSYANPTSGKAKRKTGTPR